MMHVQIEPELQEITTEAMSGRSANTTIGARLDVATSHGLWGGRRERTLMDVRVFNPFAPSNHNTTLPMLQEAREGKDSCLRTKGKRSGVCHSHPQCDVCMLYWRPFETSYKPLQTTGLPARKQMGPTLQHHPALAEMFPIL